MQECKHEETTIVVTDAFAGWEVTREKCAACDEFVTAPKTTVV